MSMQKQQQGGIFGFFMLIVLALLAGLGVYAYTLNSTISKKFESRRWDIPARVYSRPLTLKEGDALSKKDLDTWLGLLHYDKGNGTHRGSYSVGGNTYTISTRGFDYGDGGDQPQMLKIKFNGNRIAQIQSTIPTQQGFVRLEPVQVGSIYPDSNEDRHLITICQAEQTRSSGSLCSIKPEFQPLIDALIATEDRNFEHHYGISIRGTMRAFLNNWRGGSMQGGSTLTQQLVKNFYLNSERSLKRKINEAIMAVLLESQYNKSAILGAYVNEINLGQNGNQSINGFGIAAQFYFNKPLAELNLPQQALLVAIAKGPSYYNPRKYPERAKTRRDLVLQNMLATNKISQSDYDNAISSELDVVATPTIAKAKFPDFLDYIRRELNARYRPEDLKTAGLRIVSTLDPLAQIAANSAFEKRLASLKKTNKSTRQLQGALVSADPKTGAVVALVGSSSDFTGFNRAIDAKRQVGSLLKPVIYSIALQSEQYNLASGVLDEAQSYNGWQPKNYSGASHGVVPLVTALTNSYNQAAVNTGMAFGIDTFVQQLHQMGVDEPIRPYPSALLGAVDLSPMQVLGLYQVFASGGIHAPLHAIDSVIDEQGKLLQKTQITQERRLPADTVYLTNYAMQQVIEKGTAKAAKSLGNQLAGKTGTTNDTKDAWFAGYSGNYVSVVWVGRDDNKTIGLTGGSGALPIWIDYMKRLRLTPVNLPSDNVVWAWLEGGTGKATNESCDNALYLPATPNSINHEPSDCELRQQQLDELSALFGDEALDEPSEFDNNDIDPSNDSNEYTEPDSDTGLLNLFGF